MGVEGQWEQPRSARGKVYSLKCATLNSINKNENTAPNPQS